MNDPLPAQPLLPRIDILTQVDGIDFEGAYVRATYGKYGRANVAFLSVADPIPDKRYVGHPQDLLVGKVQAIAPRTASCKRKAVSTPKRKSKRL